MDVFNGDAAALQPDLNRWVGASQAQLLNTDERSAADVAGLLSAACRRIMDQYAVADALAVHFGGKTLKASRRMFVGVAVAALFLNSHSSFFSIQTEAPQSLVDRLASLPWFLIAFLASSTFTAVWIYGRAEKGEYQNKYQDYRALAEALRIQFYWRVGGLSESVVDSYLRKQQGELDWIRAALRSWHVLTTVGDSTGGPRTSNAAAQSGLPFLTHWIQDQRRYFASKARQEKQKLDRETMIIRRLLKLSGGIAIALMLVLSIPLVTGIPHLHALERLVPTSQQHQVVMVLIPMIALCAGLLHSYGQQLARSEHTRQFGRMSDLFEAGEQALQWLLTADRHDAIPALAHELGVEALDENADWLILHRERPLEVPPG
jgi:hypothetical protein